MTTQFTSTPELREIAREVAAITGSMTKLEIEAMIARLDLSLTEHRMIKVCLESELLRRTARFASLYVAPQGTSKPSLLERARGFVASLFPRRRVLAGAWS